MDNKQIEQELEDLESRLERLRALYEQYFLGLEKLEPTVLRKEIDRKLWVMRREQVRNTGLRFKLQMIIQRYNTYQQYWTRVVREIENGTYRRDIIKVAQRFGEKDAMTILGRKRADQYKRLAQNQIDRRNKRRGESAFDDEAVDRPSMPDISVEEGAPVSLSVSDLEMIEDDQDEVTPPRGLPPVAPVRKLRELPEPAGSFGEPDMEAVLLAATVGVTTWREAPPEPKPLEIQAAEAPAPPPAEEPPAAAPTAGTTKAARPAPKPGPFAVPVKPQAAPAVAKAPEPAKPAQTTTSGKSRVAELAAQMRAKKEAAKQQDDLDLDHLLAPSPSPVKPSVAAATEGPAKPSSPLAAPVVVKPAPAPTTPVVKPAPAPIAASTPSPSPAPATPVVKPAPAPIAASTPVVKPAPTTPIVKPAPAPTTPVVKPAPAPPVAKPSPPVAKPSPPVAERPVPAASSSDLSEQKMREIYAKYVGAKRAANESTAGLTYDKLAASLRAQADKLKGSHPSRSIDFEVVTKDGKTALRPVVK